MSRTATFYGETIQGTATALWKSIYKACETFHRFGIEVFDLDQRTISEQQRKWLHCDNGAIRVIMKAEKKTFMDAKVFLKVRFGRAFFVEYITPENYQKVKGVPYWECQNTFCKEVSHVAVMGYENGIRQCPKCGNIDIKLIAIKSSEDQPIKTINLWFKEMISKIPNLPEPNPEWDKTKQETSK